MAMSMAQAQGQAAAPSIQMGTRPYWLIDQMREGPLKTELGKRELHIVSISVPSKDGGKI